MTLGNNCPHNNTNFLVVGGDAANDSVTDKIDM